MLTKSKYKKIKKNIINITHKLKLVHLIKQITRTKFKQCHEQNSHPKNTMIFVATFRYPK